MKLKFIYILFLFHIFGAPAFSADNCESWFAKSKLQIDSKGCELKCSILPVDMGTFDCPNRCKDFCQAKKTTPCKIATLWSNKIKNIRPPQWPYSNENTSEMNEQEQAKLSSILKPMPAAFMPKDLDGIYKLERPRALFNLGTPSIYRNKQIILYQQAFDEPDQLSHFLIHEIAHYLHENDLKAEFQSYKFALGWKDSNWMNTNLKSKFNLKECS